MANGFGPDLGGLAAFAGARTNILQQRENKRIRDAQEKGRQLATGTDTLEASIAAEISFKRMQEVGLQTDKLGESGVSAADRTKFFNATTKEARKILGIDNVKFNTVYNNIQTITKADGTEEHYFTNQQGESLIFKKGNNDRIVAAQLAAAGAGSAEGLKIRLGSLRDKIKIETQAITDLEAEGKGVASIGLLIKTRDALALDNKTYALYESRYRDEMALSALSDPAFKLYHISGEELKKRAQLISQQAGRAVSPRELLMTYRNELQLNVVADAIPGASSPFGKGREELDKRAAEYQKTLEALRKAGKLTEVPEDIATAEPNPTPEQAVVEEDGGPGSRAFEFQQERAAQFGEDVRSRFGGPSLRRPPVPSGTR